MHEKQRKSEMKKILFKKITNNPFGFCKATATATATAEDVVEAAEAAAEREGSFVGKKWREVGSNVGGNVKEMSVYYSWY